MQWSWALLIFSLKSWGMTLKQKFPKTVSCKGFCYSIYAGVRAQKLPGGEILLKFAVNNSVKPKRRSSLWPILKGAIQSKRVRANSVSFWFYFCWLDVIVAQVSFKPIAYHSNTKPTQMQTYTFDTQLKSKVKPFKLHEPLIFKYRWQSKSLTNGSHIHAITTTNWIILRTELYRFKSQSQKKSSE